MTCGVNRITGKPLAGWPHVKQSLGVILTTRIGERLLCRVFGFSGLGLLGRNLVPQVLMRWFMALVIGISPKRSTLLNQELGEPRFRVTALSFPKGGNSPSQLQQGQIGLQITGEYMPNALEGDFTVASQQSLMI